VTPDEYRLWAQRAAAWGADYRASLRDRPVRPAVAPGDIRAQLPGSPPELPERMEEVFADFERIIVPGMTHWQHPRFFAYFPANAAPTSVVAEYLVTAMAAQGMLWQTSPAATELETVALDWFRQSLGLAPHFTGVIQDTASSATLAAVLVMRERALKWRGNQAGLAANPAVRIYGSDQVHSSIDRAIWVAGIGQDNLVRIPVHGSARSLDVAALEAAITRDRDAGLLPAGVIACVGGTSVGATDDVAAVCAVAARHNLYVHVDAAWAGSAMVCPEFRHFWAGVDEADSVVLNPHKWLGAQFDCSTHYVRDPASLVRTLAIQPEYLKTHGKSDLINYSEWHVPLGRRFRALKLWFLMRTSGLTGLRTMIRNHVAWSSQACERLRGNPAFEIVSEPMLSLWSFRHRPSGVPDLDAHNLALVNAINDDGRTYLTQTRVDGRVVIRFQVGPFDTTAKDVMDAIRIIEEVAERPHV
jgi:aromatic-L-amino-acid/L-tryptophan decarboxylase